MTYEEFSNIEYNICKEKNYYCYVLAHPHHTKEDEEKYNYYKQKLKRINNFKIKVLTQSLINISEDYFK